MDNAFGNVSYTYNQDGIRVSKTVGTSTTEYYLNGTDIIYQTDGTDSLYFYYTEDGVIGFEYNNNNYYYIKNAQNDVIGIVDSTGNKVAEYQYDPYGKVIEVNGSNLAIGNLNPFRYRSYYYDTETSLYYLQSRYYDSNVGRFINSDDVNYIGATESEISYNAFAYCENDPVNGVDPTGCLNLSLLSSIRNFKNNSFKKIGRNLYFRGKLAAAIGLLCLLARIGLIKNDFSYYRKNAYMVKDALTRYICKFFYGAYYVAGDIVDYVCKVVLVTQVLTTIFSFLCTCFTGGISITLKNIVLFIIGKILPTLSKSIEIIYYGYKTSKWIKCSVSIWGASYTW